MTRRLFLHTAYTADAENACRQSRKTDVLYYNDPEWLMGIIWFHMVKIFENVVSSGSGVEIRFRGECIWSEKETK